MFYLCLADEKCQEVAIKRQLGRIHAGGAHHAIRANHRRDQTLGLGWQRHEGSRRAGVHQREGRTLRPRKKRCHNTLVLLAQLGARGVGQRATSTNAS